MGVMPIATLTGLNATGNAITGPGYPKFICNGMPVSCLGDLAAGPAPGPIISTMHPTMIIGGRPVASMACIVQGIMPPGIPMPGPISMSIMPNLIV